MNIQQQKEYLNNKYNIVGELDLHNWYLYDYETACEWMHSSLLQLRKEEFQEQERIIVTYTSDQYVDAGAGLILKNLQLALDEVDITNSFVIVLTTNADAEQQLTDAQLTSDSNDVTFLKCDGEFVLHKLDSHPFSKKEVYQYGSINPLKIKIHNLTNREKFLLTESKTFCMYPWIHIHAFPNGDVHPCCYSEMQHKLGNAKTHALSDIWNDAPMKNMRQRMLNEEQSPACKKCYEQEQYGFFSGRQSANKHFGHSISRVAETESSGHLERFEMTYWDIRFSNLCNLKCRSCGHIFSSQWYQDQSKLAGGDWKNRNTVLNYAGRTETDMWEQLEPHLDYVEQIYFAGGEPLLMEEHYNILEELLKRGRTDVRLIYNTNFTHTDLKGRSVFEYWKQFKGVAVGASLDGMGKPAEYIRKGTVWEDVVNNRHNMLATCPEVDFYVSPTLSIMNAWHLPDFHREWVAHGLIKPQDLNVNILQDPAHYRIDIAPAEYKKQLTEKYQQHLTWLKSAGDPLGRATQGFESAVQFLNATDNTHLIDTFWRKTHELDSIRKENILDILPELQALK